MGTGEFSPCFNMAFLRSLFDGWKSKNSQTANLPLQNIQELIDAVDAFAAKSPGPELKFATLAVWAKESGFGRSALAMTHRNYANLAWDETSPVHGDRLGRGATKVTAKDSSGIDRAYYSFPSMDAFVKSYWMGLLLTPALQSWIDYKSDEPGFIRFIGKTLYPQDTGWADAVLAIATRIRTEFGQPSAAGKAHPPGAAHALAAARSWGYQLQGITVDQVAASPFDVMVIDLLNDERQPFSADQIRRMQTKPGGGRRQLIAYMSIGEAESYRDYWEPQWQQSKPSWLLKENPEWKGNFAVCFWEPDWQKTFCGGTNAYLGRIISAGFDGVYLDKCDVFEDLLQTNQSGSKKRAELERAMVDFVTAVSSFAKSRKPDFWVIMQNAEVLLAHDDLRKVIDGVAKESLLFGGDGPEKANDATEVAKSKALLDKAKAAGRSVFVVEYLNNPSKIQDAKTKLAGFGFVGTYCERERQLDQLTAYTGTIGGDLESTGPLADQRSDGVLFARSPPNYQQPRGLLVAILKSALRQQGRLDDLPASSPNKRPPDPFTSTYDTKAEAAIAKFQQERGRKADGRCRNADWVDITGMLAPSLFDRCLNLTASFEGTGFQQACGNFDGAGVTWGLIGFTLVSNKNASDGDLTEFLKSLENEFPGDLARAFGHARAAELKSILAAPYSKKVEWANSISTGPKKAGVTAEWSDGFANLGSYPGVQRLQIEAAKGRYWDKLCVRDAKKYKAADAFDVALLYDTAVQNGGISRASFVDPFKVYLNKPSTPGQARRIDWAEIIAKGSNPQYINDVRSRKMTFAIGDGVVHKGRYRLEDWGLTPESINLDQLQDQLVTFMPASFIKPSEQPKTPTLESVPGSQPLKPGQYDLYDNFKPVLALALPKCGKPNLDLNWGPAAPHTIDDLLAQNSASLVAPNDWKAWPEDRKACALMQLVAKARVVYSEEINGWWGQLEQWAYEQLVSVRDTGLPNNKWRDQVDPLPETAPPKEKPKLINLIVPGSNKPSFPIETKSQDEIQAYYGQPGDESVLVLVKCPWQLLYDGKPSSGIRIHKKLAGSLQNVLAKVRASYTDDEIKKLRLNVYDGSYNKRIMTGTKDRWSLHSYGIAIDWDQKNNGYTMKGNKASMAKPEYEDWWRAWESEGWYSLGRDRDIDWMHVQAAHRK